MISKSGLKQWYKKVPPRNPAVILTFIVHASDHDTSSSIGLLNHLR